MISISLDTSGITAELQRLVNRAPTLASQVLYTSAMHVLVPAIKEKIKENHSVFTGQLHQRIGVKIITKLGSSPTIEVGAIGVPYGMDVELGTGPHSPDPAKILEYVKKKMGYTGGHAKVVAASIMSSIEASGTKPHPFIMPVWDALKDEFWNDFRERMRRGMGLA